MSTSVGSSTNSLLEYAENLDNSFSKCVQVGGNKSQCLKILEDIEAKGKEDHNEKKNLKGRLKSAESRIKNLEEILIKNTALTNKSSSDSGLTVSSSTLSTKHDTSSVSGLTLTTSTNPSNSTPSKKTTTSTFTLSTTTSSFPKPDINESKEDSELSDISLSEHHNSSIDSDFITTGSPTVLKTKNTSKSSPTLTISSSLSYTDSKLPSTFETSSLSLSTTKKSSSISLGTTTTKSSHSSSSISLGTSTKSSGSSSISLGTSDILSSSSSALSTKHTKRSHSRSHSKKNKKRSPTISLESPTKYNDTYSDSLSDVSSSTSSGTINLYSSDYSLNSYSERNYESSSDSLDESLYGLKNRSPTRYSISIDNSKHQRRMNEYRNQDDEIQKLLRQVDNQAKYSPKKDENISEVINDLEKYTSGKFVEIDSIISKIHHKNEKARIKILEKENSRMKKNLKAIKSIIHAIKKKRSSRKVDELFGRVSEKDLLKHIAIEFHDFLGENEDISRETAIKLVSRVSKRFLSK